jgi:arsenate reductase
MAVGWTRRLQGARYEAGSAGLEARGIDPRAVVVMAEAGVDISGQRSTRLAELDEDPFDWVVTVCDHAREHCPVFPGATRVVHVGFEDPPLLARDAATEEEALTHYRRVRDEIRQLVERLPETLEAREEA